MTTSPLTQDEIRAFVIAGHGNQPVVQDLLADRPELLNARYEEWNETALGAASHVGNRVMALYLLEQGAPLTICTAAMLGDLTSVQGFLRADPTQANATGAHGIALLVHAALSGRVDILDLLLEHGGSIDSASYALHGAAAFGHEAAATWLLAHGADPQVKNWEGKTSIEIARSSGFEKIAVLLETGG